MNTHEKSVIILKFIGWRPVVMPKYHSEGFYRLADENGEWDPWGGVSETPEGAWNDAPDLYAPQNMALAWQAMNDISKKLDASELKTFVSFWMNAWLWKYKAQESQRLWLDRMVEIIKEAQNA